MSVLWDYYKYIAKHCNAVEKEDEDGNRILFQQPFSFFSPFYESQNELKLNEIACAFLHPNEFSLREYDIVMTEREIREYYENEYPSDAIKPYDAQYKAIFHAINDPVSIIQGPPGTGKTETIVNVIRQIYHKFGNQKTVAVVSNNSEAVNNVLSFIEDSPIALDREILARFARLGNQARRRAWCEKHPNYQHNSKWQPDSSVLHDFPFFISTIHSLRRIFSDMEDYQFDYVIIDESTQSSVSLGLIAMGSAKHLVVLGDEKQLSAIISKEMLNLTQEFEEKYSTAIDDLHKEKEGGNFLSACLTVFSGRVEPILLNQHYRCHPSIIGFCNEYVYDNKLIPCAKCENENDFRIRAVWYEGDYHETTVAPYDYPEDEIEDSPYGNCNMRQIRIFLEEELPRYAEMNRAYIEKQKAEYPDKEPKELSMAIIAPFRAQLNILKEKLNSMNMNALFEEELCNDNLDENEQKTQTEIPTLTVHKSQGRGYDIVYLMTVVDNNDRLGKWAQGMRMVNVAVSRAKKEFCIITTSRWLPEKLQKEMTDYTLSVSAAEVDSDSKQGLFFCKLLKYVGDNCPVPRGDYGFHKSKLTSVFDRVPYMRETEKTGKDFAGSNSAPARCMCEALKNNFGEYSILQEVPMARIEQIHQIKCSDEPLLKFMKTSKFDFVLCEGNEIKLIIEVDGSFHRNELKKVFDEYTQPQLDAFKDKWINDLGAANLFLRLPTNGENDNELEMIREKLSLRDKPVLTLLEKVPEGLLDETEKAKAAVQELLTSRNNFIEARFGEVKELITGAKPAYDKIAWAFPKYDDKNNVTYRNSLTRALYHCKYSMAYSFEYAMLWDIILRSYRNGNPDNNFDVCSFGCGSMVEAWSLAYAKARLAATQSGKGYEKLNLSFSGVDLVEWEDYLVPTADNKYFDVINPPRIENAAKFGTSVKVYIYPKLLNHLDDKALSNLLNNLCFNLGFGAYNEYYICISHNRSSVLKKNGDRQALDRTLLSTIYSRLSVLGFEVCDDIYEMLGDEKQDFLNTWQLGEPDSQDGKDRLMDITNPDACVQYAFNDDNKNIRVNKCYVFESSMYSETDVRIWELSRDFSHDAEVVETFARFDKNDLPKGCYPNCVSRVDYITFQIIRLRKKEE